MNSKSSTSSVLMNEVNQLIFINEYVSQLLWSVISFVKPSYNTK